MAEMNPIVQVMMQLIEQKQRDEQLKNQEDRDKAEAQFRMEQLGLAQQQHKAELTLRQAESAREVSKIREEIASRRRSEFGKEGTRRVAGFESIPQTVPTYQQSNLPGTRSAPPINEAILQRYPALSQFVPYDINQQDTAQPQPTFKPFDTQISESEFGPIFTEGVVPYDELRSRAQAELWDKAKFDALSKGLETRVTEAAKRPNIERQIEGRTEVANIAASQRETTANLDRTSRENIARWTNATRESVARRNLTNSKNIDSDAITTRAMSNALGETELPAGNQGTLVLDTQKKLGYKSVGKLKFDKIKTTLSFLDTINRVQEEVVPLLADTQPTAVLKGAVVKLGYPSELKNKVEPYKLELQQKARQGGVVGNMSDRDAQASMDKVMNPTTTKQQGLDRLRISREVISKDLTNNLLVGLPDKQVIELLTQPGLNFDISSIYAIDSKGKFLKDSGQYVPKYVQREDGAWGVYNPTTNKYRRIE